MKHFESPRTTASDPRSRFRASLSHALLLFSLLLAGPLAAADTVVMKDGRTVKGRVRIVGELVEVETSGGPVTFRKSEVDRIVPDQAPVAPERPGGGVDAPPVAEDDEPEPEADLPPEYRQPALAHLGRYLVDVRSPDSRIVRRSLRALGVVKSPRAIAPLLAVHGLEQDPEIRRRIGKVLFETDEAATVKALRKSATAKDAPDEAKNVMELLAGSQEREAVPCLLIYYLHQDPAVAELAAKSLVARRTIAIPILVEAGQKTKGLTRLTIIRLLGRIRDARAVPWISRATTWDSATNAEQEVVRTALRSIGVPAVPELVAAMRKTSSSFLVSVLWDITGTRHGIDDNAAWNGWMAANELKIEAINRERFPEDFREPEGPAGGD